MDVVKYMQNRFETEKQEDLLDQLPAGALNTPEKVLNFFARYREEVERRYPNGKSYKCRWLRGHDYTRTCIFKTQQEQETAFFCSVGVGFFLPAHLANRRLYTPLAYRHHGIADSVFAAQCSTVQRQ